MTDQPPIVFGQYPPLYKVRMSRELYERICALAEKNDKSFRDQLVELLKSAQVIGQQQEN